MTMGSTVASPVSPAPIPIVNRAIEPSNDIIAPHHDMAVVPSKDLSPAPPSAEIVSPSTDMGAPRHDMAAPQAALLDDLQRRETILNFWLGPDRAQPKSDTFLWLESSEEREAEIRTMFLREIEIAGNDGFQGWLNDAYGSLALILLLDELSIRAFRGEARGFDYSAKAIAYAYATIARGFDLELSPKVRMWIYLPLMRSELLVDQDNSVKAHELGGLDTKWALEHREIIRRFGRFPTRNKVYGRESTLAEREFLSRGGSL